ncbi:MAG: hypothetical protein MUF83_12745 [Acidimicrobiales bacterium]|nr:hypothetical protein [Acidimicrobiales bacterium]
MTTDVAPRATRRAPSLAIAASGPVLYLDYHRTPYAVADDPQAVPATSPRTAWLADEHGTAQLRWLLPDARWSPQRWDLDGIAVVARVVTEDVLAPLRRSLGGRWERRQTLQPAHGDGEAALWVRADGTVLVPFDPDEAITNLWTEAYLHELTPGMERAGALARRAYYRVRPVLPRRTQIAFRRRLARRQARTAFPRWPCETALHDLYDLLFTLVTEVAGQPVPTLGPWPAGHTWALTLTHDVETAEGIPGIEVLRGIERRHGLVSSWHFVPRRYDLPAAVRESLVREGCEIGVHGLYHDGLDVESEATLAARLPAIHAAAEAWGATGFRAPSMQRSWAAMATLGFDHDLSFPDTDPFQPCRGGCCSWWPLLNGPVVELPLTLAQDHTLFEILRQSGPRTWLDKTDLLRARRGLAQLLVHPDYLAVPGVRDAYAAYLDTYAGDPDVWHALPSQVSAWWRARAASRIDAGENGWEVRGPAADAAEVLVVPVGA